MIQTLNDPLRRAETADAPAWRAALAAQVRTLRLRLGLDASPEH